MSDTSEKHIARITYDYSGTVITSISLRDCTRDAHCSDCADGIVTVRYEQLPAVAKGRLPAGTARGRL
jgi:hypothetical protein